MENHRIFLRDQASQELFQRAIHESVRPGDTVLDLGTGTGIHTLFACKAGARRVYAVDADDVIHLAREVVRKNRCDDRVVFIQGLSSRIELPEKVDVIVTNQGLVDALDYLTNARERFLKRGGHLIPSRIRLFFVPVDFPQAFNERIRFWTKPRYGLDFSPLHERAVNELQYVNLMPKHFLARPVGLSPMDLMKNLPIQFKWKARFFVSRSGILHGLGAWFEYQLSAKIKLSTRPPLAVGSPPWKNIFFPLERVTPVKKGDRVEIEIHLCPNPNCSIWKWKVEISRKRNRRWLPLQQFSHCDFNRLPLSKEALKKHSPLGTPRLTPWGEARLSALSLCNGQRALSEIEQEVYRGHPKLFRSLGEAAGFVAEDVTRNSCDNEA